MSQTLAAFMQLYKDKFFEQYSTYVTVFSQKNINLKVKMQKVSYINGLVTISAKVELIPTNGYKEKERFWKSFATKLVTLREYDVKKYKVVFVHHKSMLFNWFLDWHLHFASSTSPYCVCKENLGNLFIRMLCFSRFEKFPTSYRGKSFSVVLFIALLLFLAFIIGTIKSYYAWY